MRAANGREAALEAMRRQRRAGAYSADAVDAVIREAALEPREAAFCTRIVRETLQNLYFIDHYLDLWCKTPTKRLEPAVLDILRDEVTHNLLAGEVAADAQLRGTLQLLRSFVSPDKQAILFDFDLPQGEVYLSAQWHYGSERLENALRNNFFGRYYDDIYYCVAVLTPRHIRVAACQRYDTESISEEDLLQKANSHVEQVLDNIKEYLGLDMVTTDCHILDKLCLLTQEHQQPAEG